MTDKGQKSGSDQPFVVTDKLQSARAELNMNSNLNPSIATTSERYIESAKEVIPSCEPKFPACSASERDRQRLQAAPQVFKR